MSTVINFDDHFKTMLAKDVRSMIVGDLIGYGSTRAVYAHAISKKHVVKLEDTARSFYNAHEYMIWQAVKDTEFAEWFAPITDISPSGLVLVMERTITLQEKDLPKRVPSYFTDLKAENFGWLNGRIVAHDYGHNLLFERGLSKRMKKADWTLAND